MNQDYVGTTKRTFKAAVVHLLETNYGMVGSRRILNLLADDLQALVDQFYPAPQYISSGWMVFTGTKAKGPKARPGQSASDYQLVTLAWPVLLPEDVQSLASLPKGQAGVRAKSALLQQRLVRILEYGWQHPRGPVLLTRADLAAMLSLSPKRVGELLAQARQSTAKPLLTKGYYFDQGMRPTHKHQVIALYEAGLDETAIARQTGHAQTSVGRYIRDYERVKLLLAYHTPVERIPHLIGMQPNVVRAHLALVHQHHPDLFPGDPALDQT
jgi:hypothetical protein